MENRDKTKTREQLLNDTVLLNAKIARLEKDKEIFQVIAENTSDNIAITSFDLKAEYLYVSPSVKHVLDYDPKDLVGKSFFDFIHPDDKKVLFPLLKKYVNHKIKKLLSGKNIPVSKTVDFRFRKKNGDWCFMQSAINIVGNQFISVTRDITERKRAEKALKESEKQLQTLIDAMPDFVCFKDGDGCWLKANNACIRIFQLEDIDYRGKTDSELAELNSNLRGTFLTCKETDTRAWEGEGVFHGEETVPDPDGSVRIYDMTKLAVLQPDGERIGLVVLGHDITERKQAEEMLQESEDRLRQIIDIVPHMIFAKDRNGRFIIANKAVADGCGITPEKMVGKTHPELLGATPEQYESYLTDDREVIDSGKLKFIPEENYTFPDGHKVIMETTKIPFTSAGIPTVLGVSIDITDRKQAAEELAKHRENLEELVQERTKELEDKNIKLEKFNKLFVDREFRIKELRDKLKKLEGK